MTVLSAYPLDLSGPDRLLSSLDGLRQLVTVRRRATSRTLPFVAEVDVDPLFTVILTIRKLFGYLVPGFVWLLLLLIWSPGNLRSLPATLTDMPGSSVFVVATGLIASYYLGSLASMISFRISELFADWLDRWCSRLRQLGIRRFIAATSRRFHILSLATIQQDRERLVAQMAGDPLLRVPATDQPGSTRFGMCKMYVLEKTPGLAKEVLDVEGEINFSAGLWLPSVVAGAWLLRAGWTGFGVALCLAAVFLLLRFQNLRHHELLVIEKTYAVARHLTTKETDAEET